MTGLIIFVLLVGLTILKDEILHQSSNLQNDFIGIGYLEDNQKITESEKKTGSSFETGKVCDSCTPTELKGDKFTLEIIKIEQDSLLSRIITARILVNENLNNVKATLELFAGDERIIINGGDYVEVYLGNLKRNEAVEREVRISVDLFGAMKIRESEYVNLVFTLHYDGGEESVAYKLKMA